MLDLLNVIVSMSLQIALPYWVVRRDERNLTECGRARSFPDSTFWVAIVVFGPLSIPIHYLRTRRSVTGLMLGLLWFTVVVAIVIAAGVGLAFILE